MNSLAVIRRIHTLCQVNGANAINGRVMKLGIDRKLVILEAFDQVHFPQRAIAIQQGTVQPRHQRKQLAEAPGLGQCRVANMVFQIQCSILLPEQRPQHAHATHFQFVTKGRLECLRGAHIVCKAVQKLLLIGPLRQGEEIETTHMHGGFTALKHEESAIDHTQSFHGIIPPLFLKAAHAAIFAICALIVAEDICCPAGQRAVPLKP